jgi:hypothetical protein
MGEPPVGDLGEPPVGDLPQPGHDPGLVEPVVGGWRPTLRKDGRPTYYERLYDRTDGDSPSRFQGVNPGPSAPAKDARGPPDPSGVGRDPTKPWGGWATSPSRCPRPEVESRECGFALQPSRS